MSRLRPKLTPEAIELGKQLRAARLRYIPLVVGFKPHAGRELNADEIARFEIDFLVEHACIKEDDDRDSVWHLTSRGRELVSKHASQGSAPREENDLVRLPSFGAYTDSDSR